MTKTDSETKRYLLMDKIKQIKEISAECSNLINEMLDSDTYGSSNWSLEFKEDTESLQNYLRSIRRKINEYLNTYK